MVSDQTQTFPDLQDAARDPAPQRSPGGAGPLGPGAVLGRYVILHKIGSGGMAEVHAAYDPDLDRKVALKVVPEPSADRPGGDLLLEAQALARWTHPNIVTVHDVGRHGNRVFLAMELVDGVSLTDWLKMGPRSWRQILDLFVQAGRGLEAAHAEGWIHRDFKPQNVLVSRHGVAKVADFGVAWNGEPRGSREQASASKALSVGPGTPAYLAPERLECSTVDARSDQFSFCIALYRALYGVHPFPADDLDDLLDQVSRGEAVLPAHHSVPGWLRPVLLQGMSRRPEDRYASMTELLDALRPPRSSRAGWGVAAPVLVLALGLVAGLGWSRRPSSEDRLADIWNAARKARIEESFLRHAPRVGAATFARVDSMLDAYLQEWRKIYAEASEHETQPGDDPRWVAELQRMCLDARLAEVEALTRLFAQSDETIVESAERLSEGLSSLETCRDKTHLASLELPRLDSGRRASVASIRGVVEEQYARFLGHREVDRRALDEAVEASHEVGYPPLEARALELRSKVRSEAGEDGAIEDLHRALQAAVAGGDKARQVGLYAYLAVELALRRGSLEESRVWERLAAAGLSTLGPGQKQQRVTVLHNLGVWSLAAGRNGEALGRLQRAFELAEALWGPDSPHLTALLNDLAISLSYSDGTRNEVLDLLSRSIEMVERSTSSGIGLARRLVNRGAAYAVSGEYAKALEDAARAVDVLRAKRGEHRDVGYPLLLAGQVLNALDRPQEAVPQLEEAATLIAQGYGDRHPLLAEVWTSLAESRRLQMRTDEAERCLESSRRILETGIPDDYPLRATMLRIQGQLELLAGRYGDAHKTLGRAEVLIRRRFSDAFERRQLLVSLAEASLGLDRIDQARTFALEALELRPTDADPTLAAQARFVLARSVMASDRGRAAQLAKEALRGLDGGSPYTRWQRSRVIEWLTDSDLYDPVPGSG